MTDKETLLDYRIRQAEETLADAEKMLSGGFGLRSIVNRAYYAMFYALLALFLKADVRLKTSKHAGVISVFDKEFVRTGKFGVQYSKLLHRMFDARLEGDYKELVIMTQKDATEAVKGAKEFLSAVYKFIEPVSAD